MEPRHIVMGPGEILKPQALVGWMPLTLTTRRSATSSSSSSMPSTSA